MIERKTRRKGGGEKRNRRYYVTLRVTIRDNVDEASAVTKVKDLISHMVTSGDTEGMTVDMWSIVKEQEPYFYRQLLT
jgi:hypothetical protein